MRLYRREDAERLAAKKFGTVEQACQTQARKAKRARKRRLMHYEASKKFSMKLRSPRSTKFVRHANPNVELASRAQIRYFYFMTGEALPLGTSMEDASKEIQAISGRVNRGQP